MIRATSLANAITTMVAAIYVACAALSAAAPDFLLGLTQSWVHAINLEAIRATTPNTWGSFAVGLITAVALTWVVTYMTAGLYNYFVGREVAERRHKGYAAA